VPPQSPGSPYGDALAGGDLDLDLAIPEVPAEEEELPLPPGMQGAVALQDLTPKAAPRPGASPAMPAPKTPLEARNTPGYYARSSEQRHQDALVEYFSMTVLAVQLAVDAKKAKKSGAFGGESTVKVPDLYREVPWGTGFGCVGCGNPPL